MEEKALSELLKNGMNIAGSMVNTIVGAILTTLFLRKNTANTEFEKIKAAKFADVVDELLDNGKMSYLEYWKCKNFLKIAQIADDARSSDISKISVDTSKYYFDWFIKYYDYASSVSNEEMQKLWAGVLSREISQPGTTSLSLLHSLSIMDSDQARFFCNISRFCLRDIDYNPNLLLFVSTNRAAYKASLITPERLKELERFGLIDCDFASEYVFFNEKTFRISNKNIAVYGDSSNDNKIKAGNAIFTNDGIILYQIIDDIYKQYNPQNLDFIITRFKARNCRVIVNDREV